MRNNPDKIEVESHENGANFVCNGRLCRRKKSERER